MNNKYTKINDLPKFDAVFEPSFWQDPHPIFEQAFGADTPLLNTSMEVPLVLRYDVANALCRDPRIGVATAQESIGPLTPRDTLVEAYAESLLLTNPPRHGARKTTLKKYMNAEKLKFFSGYIDTLTSELVESCVDGGESDILTTIASPLAVRTLCKLAGLPKSDGPLLEKWSYESTELSADAGGHGQGRQFRPRTT